MQRKMKAIGTLSRVSASDVKKLGWRGVMRTLGPAGMVTITHHDAPEAVVLSASEYERIAEIVNQVESRTEAELEALRRRFDDRLALLRAPEAGDRLRSIFRAPAHLEGGLEAGSGF